MPIFGKEHDNTFTYSATDQAPPFPLDYTTGELKEKWDVSWDNLIKRMFKHPQFLDFFLWLKYDEKTLKKEKERKKQGKIQAAKKNPKDQPYNGLPPELEPFMRLYMKAYASKKAGNSSVNFDQLIPDFCIYLHELAMNAEHKAECTPNGAESDTRNGSTDESPEVSTPDDRYWYRLLYKNEGFQEAIINSYWKKEYDSRTKTAKELFLKMPYDFQIQALMQNICHLDTQIASMLQTIEQNKEHIPVSNRTSSFLKTFPTELLNSLRPKVPVSNDSERATFSIKNFTIHKPAATQDKDLLSYLKDIVNDQNPEVVKKEIRPYYLQEICQIPDAPPFLTECLKLQKYLDSSTTNNNGNWDEVDIYVYTKSRELYQAALRFDPFPATTSTNFRNDHIGSMLDQLIFNMYNSFMGMYGQDFDYLRYWLNFRPSEQTISNLSPTIIPDHEEASKILLELHNVSLNAVYSISGKTLRIPVLSWNDYQSRLFHLVGNDIYSDFYVLFEPLSDTCIANLSAQLKKTCLEAYKFMNLEAPDWISESIFTTAWQHYSQALTQQKVKDAQSTSGTVTTDDTNTIGTTADDVAPPGLIPTENYYLLTALMVQRIFQAYLTNCRTTISAYKNYMNFMQRQK